MSVLSGLQSQCDLWFWVMGTTLHNDSDKFALIHKSQIPVARSSWRLNSVRWHMIFLGPQ